MQQINETINAKGIALFKVEDIYFSKNWGNTSYAWGMENNPNVAIWYYLTDNSNVSITIKNKEGIVVFNRQAKAEKGLLKLDYDLSIDEKTKTAIEKKDSKIKISQAENKKQYLNT